MFNFTSIYFWEATKFAKSLIKPKESGFRPPNLVIFFLTEYTMIHSVHFAPSYPRVTLLGGDNSFDHPVLWSRPFLITIRRYTLLGWNDNTYSKR